MRTLIHDDEIKAVAVSYRNCVIHLELENGRKVSAPLEFLPVIKRNVNEADLKASSLISGGTAIRFGSGETVSVVSVLGLDDGYVECRSWRDKGNENSLASLI